MTKQPTVPEIDILIGCSLWLCRRGALPLAFSIASGHGIDANRDRQRLLDALDKAGFSNSMAQFRPDGPDVTAVSKSEFWQVECKGAGEGKQSTQRNNFDRALSSTVTYFTDRSPRFSGELSILNSATPFLGLALPATREYLDQLQRRVRSPLRKRLNLWVSLYDLKSLTITAVSPDESFPKSQTILPSVDTSLRCNVKSDTQMEGPPRRADVSPVREPRKVIVNPQSTPFISSRESDSGESLNRQWNVGARHALYHKDGAWYMPLERFPGAYFDPRGYVLFRTESDYLNSSYLSIGKRVNVKNGISRVPGYRKMR